MSKLHTYDDVVERVAQKLGLDDPSKIRLTSHKINELKTKVELSHPDAELRLLEMFSTRSARSFHLLKELRISMTSTGFYEQRRAKEQDWETEPHEEEKDVRNPRG